MADNQDYRDIQRMTNNNSEDIDILFNNDDDLKIIIPSKDELKDFPEERLNDDDYISDDDLDFVDSMLEEEQAEQEKKVLINLDETEEEEKPDLISSSALQFTADTTSVNIPENNYNINLNLDVANPEYFNDKIDVSNDADIYFPYTTEDIKKPEKEEDTTEEPEVIEIPDESSDETVEDKIEVVSDELEEEPLVIPDEPLIISDEDEEKSDVLEVNEDIEDKKTIEPDETEKLEEPEEIEISDNIENIENIEAETKEEQEIPEISSENTEDENDRIEIVVKNIDQEVILPPTEQQLTDDIILGKSVLDDTPLEKLKDTPIDMKDEVDVPIINMNKPSDVKEEEPVVEIKEEETKEEEPVVEIKNEETNSEEAEIVSLDQIPNIPDDDILTIDDIKSATPEFDETLLNNDGSYSLDQIPDIADDDIISVDDLKQHLTKEEIEEVKTEAFIPGTEDKQKVEKSDEIIFINNDLDKEIPINFSKYDTHDDDYKIVEADEETPSTTEEVKIEIPSEKIVIPVDEKKEPATVEKPKVEKVEEVKEVEEVKIVKTEEEELLEENVFAVSSIDSKKGFYLGKKGEVFALYGYINDEIFMLKEFPELYNKNLGFRLDERTKHYSSYLVKANDSKLLVNVDKESMTVVLDL